MNDYDRQRLIKATGICLHENCKAHDSVLEKINELEAQAYERGIDNGYDAGFDAANYGR